MLNFAECHGHVDVAPLYTACLYDVCDCDRNIKHCLCSTIATYATMCARAGVEINWRAEVSICSKYHIDRQ